MNLDERVRTLETQLSVVDATTSDFREYLIKKIDKVDTSINEVKTRIFELPCKERKHIGTQLKFLWGIISIIITAIVYEWVKNR